MWINPGVVKVAQGHGASIITDEGRGVNDRHYPDPACARHHGAPLQVLAGQLPACRVQRCSGCACLGGVVRPVGQGGPALLIGRSSRLDRAGWEICLATGFAHMSDHKKGGRL
jgi:hypothetical protein